MTTKDVVFKRAPLLERQCMAAGLTAVEVKNTRLKDLRSFLEAYQKEFIVPQETKAAALFQQSEWSLMQETDPVTTTTDTDTNTNTTTTTEAVPPLLSDLPVQSTQFTALLRKSDGHHRLHRVITEALETLQQEASQLKTLIQSTEKYADVMNEEETVLLQADLKRRLEDLRCARNYVQRVLALLGNFVQRRSQVEDIMKHSQKLDVVKARTKKMSLMYQVFRAQLDHIAV